MVSVAVTCFTVMAVALFAVVAAGSDSLAVLVAMLFLAFAWLGLVIPSTMVLSLEDHGPIAGMASALGGTLQMITGAVMIVVASAFFNGTALPMVTTIAVCAVAAFILTRLTLRPKRRRHNWQNNHSVFERSMPSGLTRGWEPVRVKKTRQLKMFSPRATPARPRPRCGYPPPQTAW